jgi:hypothetical protein
VSHADFAFDNIGRVWITHRCYDRKFYGRPCTSRAAIVSHLDGDGISQNYEITCDESGANALLSVAQVHSPSAFQKITAVMGKK